MKVREIMSSPAVTVNGDTPLPEVARLMQQRNIGAIPVVDGAGKLIGMITETDFTGVGRAVPFSLDLAPVVFGARAATVAELERIYAMARKLKAKEAMTEKIQTTTEDEEVGRLVQRMLDKDFKHVPVVRDGKPVGMVARHDVLKLMLGGAPV